MAYVQGNETVIVRSVLRLKTAIYVLPVSILHAAPAKMDRQIAWPGPTIAAASLIQ